MQQITDRDARRGKPRVVERGTALGVRVTCYSSWCPQLQDAYRLRDSTFTSSPFSLSR